MFGRKWIPSSSEKLPLGVSTHGFLCVWGKRSVQRIYPSALASKSMQVQNPNPLLSITELFSFVVCSLVWLSHTLTEAWTHVGVQTMFVSVWSAYIKVPIWVLAGGSTGVEDRWGARHCGHAPVPSYLCMWRHCRESAFQPEEILSEAAAAAAAAPHHSKSPELGMLLTVTDTFLS